MNASAEDLVATNHAYLDACIGISISYICRVDHGYQSECANQLQKSNVVNFQPCYRRLRDQDQVPLR